MHFRQKLTFMAFGSILTLAGYLLATLAGDVTAQPETDKATVFDKIVCRLLTVVDADGEEVVAIGTANVEAEEGGLREGGGWIQVSNEDGRIVVDLGAEEFGGSLRLYDNTPGSTFDFGMMGEPPRIQLGIDTKEHGFIYRHSSDSWSHTWPEGYQIKWER